jgi:hypothetical protein
LRAQQLVVESMTLADFVSNSRKLLARLLDSFEEKTVYVRSGTVVDAALGAHLRRAARAHESLLTLVAQGFGEDSQVLARVGLDRDPDFSHLGYQSL